MMTQGHDSDLHSDEVTFQTVTNQNVLCIDQSREFLLHRSEGGRFPRDVLFGDATESIISGEGGVMWW